jgi:hypothetical protein
MQTRLTLDVDESIYRQLQDHAHRTGRATSRLIREATAEYAGRRRVTASPSIFDGNPYRVGAVLKERWAEDDILCEMLR